MAFSIRVCMVSAMALLGSVHAATPPRSVETLVREVLSSNPEIAFYQAEIAAAKAAGSVAARLPNPELNIDIGRARHGAENVTAESTVYSASLMQPIEWPGRLGLRKAIANRDIELAQLGLERFKFHLASRARVLAYSLAAQQEVSRAANAVAARYADLQAVMVQREPAGIAPQLELTTIEAAAVISQSHAAKADIEVQRALLELNQLMGLRADSPLIVIRPAFTLATLPDSDGLLQLAMENNFELRIRRWELEQQGFKVNLARNERRPTFSVGPYVSKEPTQGDETVMGLSVSMPIPLWDSGRSKVSAAQARQIQAEATLKAAQRETEKHLMEAVMGFRSHQKRLDVWKSGSIPNFGQAAALADRHYRLGAVPIATYVELQDKYLEAVAAISEAQVQTLEAGLALEELTGAPGSIVKLTNPQTGQ